MTDHNRASESHSVLIVDDDPNFRLLVKTLLEATGCQVLQARSAKDADVILRENRPALFIVDYRLPGVDGMQWIGKVRERGWQTPIIFLSGTWCDIKTFTRLRTILGVSLILQKPIVPELFVDQIESLLPRRLPVPAAAEEILEPLESFTDEDIFDPLTPYATPTQSPETLRHLFDDEEVADTPSKETVPQYLQSPPKGKAAMRKSSTRLPAFFKPEQLMQSPTEEFAKAVERSLETDSAHDAGKASGRTFADDSSGDLESDSAKEFNNESLEARTNKSTNEADSQSSASPDAQSNTEAPLTVPLSRDKPEEMAIIASPEPDELEQLVRFNQKAAVEMALRQARSDYAKVLPGQVESMSEAVKTYQRDNSNTQAFDEALQIAHQLKGTSGSLGFPHLGRTAGVVESLLRDGGTSDPKTAEKTWQQIERQVAQCLGIAHSNAHTYAEPDAPPRKAFGNKVALVGPSNEFAALTHELSKADIAEAYLLETLPELLASAKNERFNCVIVDSEALGQESPTELLEQVRKHPSLRNSPVAFIADQNWHHDEALWFYTGAEFLLNRSVTFKELRKVVESMLVLNAQDKPRVLTVDDDVVLTGFICDTLIANGITATAENEPINVFKKLEDYPADLILLDVVMPGISGYDVCRMLRADERYAKLPILFLTSKNSQQGRAAAFKAGADDFLSKPILTEELITRVRSRLELSPSFAQRAGVDDQTGMTTRQAFLQNLQPALTSAVNGGHFFSVAIVTIDGFNELAVSLGFKGQERMFTDLAQLLQVRFRVEDLKGHWSEGSFVLGFPNIETHVVKQALTFLAGEFAVGTTHNSSGEETASKRSIRIGIAELITDGTTADTMLAHAYERSLRTDPVDVSKFLEMCREDDFPQAEPAASVQTDASASQAHAEHETKAPHEEAQGDAHEEPHSEEGGEPSNESSDEPHERQTDEAANVHSETKIETHSKMADEAHSEAISDTIPETESELDINSEIEARSEAEANREQEQEQERELEPELNASNEATPQESNAGSEVEADTDGVEPFTTLADKSVAPAVGPSSAPAEVPWKSFTPLEPITSIYDREQKIADLKRSRTGIAAAIPAPNGAQPVRRRRRWNET